MSRTRSFETRVLCALLLSLLTTAVFGLPKITRSGRYLYSEDGSRFYIKGVAYQEQGNITRSPDNTLSEPHDFIDPLSLPEACARDLPYLRRLGVNVVHVYSVDDTLNHDACMSAFEGAGIYTIIDLTRPLNGSIDRFNPTWTTNLLNQYILNIDAFSKYTNVLAFNIGNEVVTGDRTNVAPFVKAAARDVKAYLKSKGSHVLVGYGSIDGSDPWRVELAGFLSCDPSGNNSEDTAIDLYGLNIYTWCGDSSFDRAYAATQAAFSDFNIAAYLNEFGCASVRPRIWTEVEAIFSTQMSPVWSGGVAFSFFPAESQNTDFGMVTISSDGRTLTTGADFDNLVTEYGKVDFGSINSPARSSAPAAAYPNCAGPTDTFVASTTLPPTPNEKACTCALESFGCRYKPSPNHTSDVIRDLTNNGCSLLGQSDPPGNCIDINSDGAQGVYGQFSECNPIVKVSAVMNQYYYRQNKVTGSCDFAGNGTTVSNSIDSLNDSNSAVTACFAKDDAVFTPTGAGGSTPKPTQTGPGATGGGGSGGGNTGGNKTGGALPLLPLANSAAILLMGAVLGITITVL